MRISDWSSDVCSSDLGGWWFATAHPDIARSPAEAEPVSLGTLAAIGAAMTPIMFAYGGWQTSGFVAGEMRNPGRDLGRGLLLGVTGVVLLYTAVAFVCLHALGPAGLAQSAPPATDTSRLAPGGRVATLVPLRISISPLG